MKTIGCLGRRSSCGGTIGRSTSTVMVLSLILSLAGAAPAGSAPPPPRSDPFEKGATRLLEHRAPEFLPSATNCPWLRELTSAWDGLSPALLRCPTSRSNHLVQLAVHRIAQHPDRPVLVFIHGVLADHLMWNCVAPPLAEDCELWLVDLPGCGDGDAPKPSALEPDGYSPTAMGERILQALQHCLDAEPSRPSRRITLVGHSLGGTVVIRMLSDPDLRQRYARVQEQVERAVLFSPCDLAISALPPQFVPILKLKGWQMWIGEFLGVIEPTTRKGLRSSFQVPECATREREQSLRHILEDGRHRQAAQAMLLQAVPFDPKTWRPNWPAIESLVAQYTNLPVPALIVYGTRDETLSSAMGHKLKDQVPGAVLVTVPGRSHSVPTEEPVLCASLIRRFQAGSPLNALAARLPVTVYPGSPTPIDRWFTKVIEERATN